MGQCLASGLPEGRVRDIQGGALLRRPLCERLSFIEFCWLPLFPHVGRSLVDRDQHSFILAGCAQRPGEGGIREALNGNDVVEVGLRRLASQIYFDRTKDHSGSRALFGITPPGSGLDIAPSWLISDVTAYSKAEFQRKERVRTQETRQRRSTDDKGKGKGKKGANKGEKKRNDTCLGRRRVLPLPPPGAPPAEERGARTSQEAAGLPKATCSHEFPYPRSGRGLLLESRSTQFRRYRCR